MAESFPTLLSSPQLGKNQRPLPNPSHWGRPQATHVKGGNYFGTAHSGPCEGSGAEQRRQFRLMDLNNDNKLDFNEVCAFLRAGDSSISDSDVQRLFQAMDLNQDGKIDLAEFREFLDHEGGSKGHKAWKRKLRMASENSSNTDPCDYSFDDRAKSKTRRTSSVSIGRAPGHLDDSGMVPSPGPTTYRAEHASAAFAEKQPSVTIGRGPGHSVRLSEKVSPGPLCYNTVESEKAQRPHTTAARIGSGPAHNTFSSTVASPGPGAYQCNYSRLGNLNRTPAARIGSGPGHKVITAEGMRADDVPGPAAYNTAARQTSGSFRFGTEQRFCLPRLRVL
mmetsp:Transcript_31466/g.57140  ORF Transcript_31466/g.57140 Transcript_31466/m.57140 type:complete len:335 (-) Transcript_31466:57-1061(-)|eukprot:CAMPEP_0197663842 /NCGR_PEP_ID=MMETSP1338-20131121/58272_1 /TAXON_ID=43686 ORGANISM="Pelagodinium beii, Strain RCC1491" /NCGR_SAMPLE_ID=MMETSP1338 /ASSEMBLY_ACC=CAM_ASM_000754 /LENGTH=334 /DNA_ID=CAMNT_0043242351 /DNA_START=137 /DNA_END=1141 /DNA_ORIENTATION=-